jgi:exosome complex component MTR3
MLAVLQPGLIGQASGSAYVEAGKTKMVCAVCVHIRSAGTRELKMSRSYGPHPTRRDAPFSAKARLNVEVRFAPFACRGRRKTPGKVHRIPIGLSDSCETAAQDAESPYLAAQLHQALLPAIRLDLMPKSAIDVFVTIIECDGPEHDISLYAALLGPTVDLIDTLPAERRQRPAWPFARPASRCMVSSLAAAG